MQNRYDFVEDINPDIFFIRDLHTGFIDSLTDYVKPQIIDAIDYNKDWVLFTNGFYVNHVRMITRRYNEDFFMYNEVVKDYLKQ